MADDELLGSRYEVLRTVSEGRRASVLQALDTVHDRLVALKVYPVTDEDRDELLAEARLLMSIDPHPGLPVVRGDFFTDDGDRYVVVMNWVDGTDLQQVLEEQGDPGLPLQDVIDDLAQVADALDHLHGHEPPIVHGDVKPANVVRTPKGRVVLVDFDIAGAHAGKGRLGTVGYVAPEVAAGEKPDPAADVYGLAATAVTLLNGQPATDAAPSYPGIDPDQPGELARVLRAGLSVDPARRPRSATRLVEKLRDSRRAEHLQGVIALLATEVADAARLWSDEPEEMQVAMRRLRDVEGRGHRAARRAGRHGDERGRPHDRRVQRGVGRRARCARPARPGRPRALPARDRCSPPCRDRRRRGGIGRRHLHGRGGRQGAAPALGRRARGHDHLRSTADMLVDRVGRDMSIVPLGARRLAGLPSGARRSSDSPAPATRARPPSGQTPSRPPHCTWPNQSSRARARHEGRAGSHRPGRGAAPSTLVALTVVGFALIFLLVLSPELGMAGLATAALGLGAIAFTGCFAWHYSHGYAA